MNILMAIFSTVGMVAVFMGLISIIIWIVIRIEDRNRRIRKPPTQTIDRPEAPVLGTQIRRPGNEPDHSRSFLDW